MAKRKTTASGQPKSKPIEKDDDSFGLPEIEPQPLSNQPEEPATLEESASAEESYVAPAYEPSAYTTQESSFDPAPVYTAGETVEFKRPTAPPADVPVAASRPVGVIVAGILIVVLAMGGLIYWFVVKPHQEKAKTELLAQQEKERLEQERKAIEEEERRRREAAEAENQINQQKLNEKAAVGAIDTLTERARRYYVVLASSVDGDLIMDYARKLSAKGVSTNILPPSDKLKFTRLTMGNFDTYAAAQSAADVAKADYGSNLWVIRY